MKKIIKNKKYDTETATLVGEWDNSLARSDFRYMSESLYRKRTGELFLYGEGGPLSRYAERRGDGWMGSEDIMPLSYEAAREWAEEHLTADEYEGAFGAVSEDGEGAVVSCSVSARAKAALEREAAKTGQTQSAVLERLLLGLEG